jgi:hypothetical protein
MVGRSLDLWHCRGMGKLTRIKVGRCARIRRAEINAVIRGDKVIEP